MSQDLKKILDDLNTAFAQFREANDERLRQIEARGSADTVLVQKVEKANADITNLCDRIKEIENSSARLNAGGTPQQAADEVASASRFFALMKTERGEKIEEIPQATAAEVEAYRAYKKAFNKYLRVGGRALSPEYRAALSVGSDPAGGYFVEPDTTGRIVKLIYETSPIRQLADVVTISTDAYEGLLDLDEGDSGWTGETSARTETNTPEVGKWRIPVMEQWALPKTTQKNLDDSSLDIGAWLEGKIADKLSRKENNAFVLGDGVNKPRGFLTYPAGVPTKAAWGKIAQVNSGAAGAFAATNPGDKLIDLVFGLKAAYRQGAVWVMARATVAESRKLKDGQGNYLWQPDFTSQQGARLLGFPIVEGEDMPAMAANSLSIAFGNFKLAYQIVDRQGIRVLRDPYTAKPYILFYSTKRVGGDVQNFEAIRLMKFA